jgi:dipeptidyl aminopeptidase/acylaminoacyl peptidase
MRSKWLFALSVLLVSVSCTGANPNPNSNANTNTYPTEEQSAQKKTDAPSLGSPTVVANGVLRYEVKFKRGGNESKVWIYFPDKPAQSKLPCVLIAPAGSHLFDGASLGVGDQPEHLPYVLAGFVVVAYEIDGEIKGNSNAAAQTAIAAFRRSDAGLVNEKNALDFALANVSLIDPDRIYVAGHSSAATHALLVAANETRVKAVAAYAPATDLVDFIGNTLASIDEMSPGFAQFISQRSPVNFVDKIRVPVFLFHAKDDTVIAGRNMQTFVTKVKRTNPDVTYVEVDRGGHYESMIQPGIGRGIAWLKQQKP